MSRRNRPCRPQHWPQTGIPQRSGGLAVRGGAGGSGLAVGGGAGGGGLAVRGGAGWGEGRLRVSHRLTSRHCHRHVSRSPARRAADTGTIHGPAPESARRQTALKTASETHGTWSSRWLIDITGFDIIQLTSRRQTFCWSLREDWFPELRNDSTWVRRLT